MRLVLVPSALVGALASLSVDPALAATSTTNMSVSIQITAACTISVTNINYGSVPSTALTSAQTSTPGMGGAFSYTCSPGTAAPALTAGQGGNFNAGSNRMKGATLGGFLPYTLNLPTIATFTGSAQSAQITATIPAQATLPAVDTYTDTVVLTLSY